jgi:glyoxylase-like metal-dependent hydrolase (beta-lactamase superfamily II)
MQLGNTRRAILRAAAGAAGAALVPAGVRRALAAGEIARQPLGDRLSLVTGAGANVVVLETADGLALVDSGAPESAEALLAFLDAEYGGAPIRALFNTHWHLAHTGANEGIARRGATIIAHRNTRLWMGTEYYVEWEQKNYRPRPDAALPTETFYSHEPQPRRHELGGYTIEYGHLAEAHTDGDIYVRFPADDVIAVGDVLAVDAFPVLDFSTGGWIGGNQDALRLLGGLVGPRTQVIPGQGPPQPSAAIAAQLAMLDEVGERIRLEIIKGKGVDEILAANVMAGYESLPEPRRFVHNLYQGLWWGGRLRGAY